MLLILIGLLLVQMTLGASSQGTLGTGRGEIQVAQVKGGEKVLFIGGAETLHSSYSKSVDLFNTLTGECQTTWPFSDGRSGMAVTSVQDRWVVVAGGASQEFRVVSTRIDIYDAFTNQWCITEMQTARSQIAVVSIGTKVLLAGGMTSWFGQVTNLVEIYDVASGVWLPGAPLSLARSDIGAVAVGTLVAIFAGGYAILETATEPALALASRHVDIWHASNNSWTVASLSGVLDSRIASTRVTSNGTHAFFLLKQDQYHDEESIIMDVYNAVLGSWSTIPIDLLPGHAHRGEATTVSYGSHIMVAGDGDMFRTPLSTSIDFYDLTTGTMVKNTTLIRPRYSMGATVIPTRVGSGATFLFAGGFQSGAIASGIVEMFCPHCSTPTIPSFQCFPTSPVIPATTAVCHPIPSPVVDDNIPTWMMIVLVVASIAFGFLLCFCFRARHFRSPSVDDHVLLDP